MDWHWDDGIQTVVCSSDAVHRDNDADLPETLWGFNAHDAAHSATGVGRGSMGLNVDFTAVQPENGDWNGNSAISWDQWDSWLAESNAMDSFPI